VRQVLNPGPRVCWDGVQRVFGVDPVVDPDNNSGLTKQSFVCWVLPRYRVPGGITASGDS
jgi:hypothetical protein